MLATALVDTHQQRSAWRNHQLTNMCQMTKQLPYKHWGLEAIRCPASLYFNIIGVRCGVIQPGDFVWTAGAFSLVDGCARHFGARMQYQAGRWSLDATLLSPGRKDVFPPCDHNQCILPECICGTSIPGDLPAKHVPQIITPPRL